MLADKADAEVDEILFDFLSVNDRDTKKRLETDDEAERLSEKDGIDLGRSLLTCQAGGQVGIPRRRGRGLLRLESMFWLSYSCV